MGLPRVSQVVIVFKLVLRELWSFNEGGSVAGAGGRQLEALDSEREVVVVGVVHDEPELEKM